jgi:hypothetical protein
MVLAEDEQLAFESGNILEPETLVSAFMVIKINVPHRMAFLPQAFVFTPLFQKPNRVGMESESIAVRTRAVIPVDDLDLEALVMEANGGGETDGSSTCHQNFSFLHKGRV